VRIILLLALFVAQAAIAGECLRADSGQSVILRGVIEYKYDPAPSSAFSIFLNLPSPICVEGLKNDGSTFKMESVTSIQLGIPSHLNKGLRPGDGVTLRGEFWGPAINEKHASVTFALKEVL
jgi:hypothetical protein